MENYPGARFDVMHCPQCNIEIRGNTDIRVHVGISAADAATSVLTRKCPQCGTSLLPKSRTSYFGKVRGKESTLESSVSTTEGSSISEGAPSLSLYFDLDEFSPDDIAEIIGFLSELYREAGGDKLIIEDITLYNPSYALEEV